MKESMKGNIGKKFLSLLLSVVMVLGMLPTAAFATEGEGTAIKIGPCEHHECSAEECGFVEGVKGVDCTHTHDENCGYVEAKAEVPCNCETTVGENGETIHAEGCAYTPAVEGKDCTHAHDEACGYVEAVEAKACMYACTICGAEEEYLPCDEEGCELVLGHDGEHTGMAMYESEDDFDFTDATGNEVGEGWTWTLESKTLTLSGAAITTAVTLPAGSTIVVTEGTENSIVVTSGDAIYVDGALAISGTGALTVESGFEVPDARAIRATGSIIVTGTELTAKAECAVAVPSVTITDAKVDLYGYYYGIHAKTTTGTADSVVTLTNVSGKIGGFGYGGINAHSETANVTVKLNGCHDLALYNEVTNDSTSVNFNFAGVRAYTRGSGKDVLVELNDCEDISISNSTMGILAANNANAANEEAAEVKVLIQDSKNVELTGNTSCYSAVFVNNYGVENDDTANLVIDNSEVTVNAPNGSGLMTSTKSAPSEVDITDSELTITAGLTGIRTIATSAEYADTDVTGSTLTFNIPAGNNAVDESIGTTVTGISEEEFADATSEIEVIKIIKGVARIEDTGYDTLQEAIDEAEAGETVVLLKDASGAGVVIDKDVTIDFGTHTYTVNKCVGSTGTTTLGFQILKGNDVTLKNGTLAATTVTEGKPVKMLVQNYADLTLTDMTLDGTGSAEMQYVLSNNSGEIVVDGATSITAPEGAVAFDVYDYSSAGYAVPSMTINTTGTITGTFEVSETASLSISGGTFTVDPEDYLANGYTVELAGDGLFGVKVNEAKYAAKVGEQYYSSLGGAILAAKDGSEPVTLLQDVSVRYPVVVDGGTVIIDLNGKTINGTNDVYPVIRVQGDANVTVKNGAIKNETDYVFVLGASDGSSAGNLTIESGEYLGNTTIASVTKGTLTITGGAFEVNSAESTYLLNCIDANYADGSAKIVVKGGSFKGFNPADNEAETGDHISFVPADGLYRATEENGVFTVAEWNYEIHDVDDLVFFQQKVNAGNKFEGKTIKLMKDIDLSSVENWTPIGNGTNYFWGTFDGQDHTISNMTINVNDPAVNQYVGLFGGVRKATVKNLTVKDAKIDAVGARVYAGAVFGIAHSNSEYHTTANLNFENITVDGCVINAESKSGSAYIGGLAGYCYPANMKGISVSNLKLNPKASGTTFVGGLVGYMQGQNISNNGNTRAYYTVDGLNLKGISIEAETVSVLAGGFAGYTYYGYITMDDVKIDGFEADITGTTTSDVCVGGLVGLAHRSDKGHTFESVKITGLDFVVDNGKGSNTAVGGMVGYSGSPIAYSNCAVSGKIVEKCTTTGAMAGGFVGGTVSWAQSYTDCVADVDVTGSNIAGGFVGYNSVNTTYTNCEARGTVAAPTAGGFVGYANGSTYKKCTATQEPFISTLADGYKLVEEGNTLTVVKKGIYEVATKAELDDALAKAADGDVIRMTADIESNTVLAITKAITLDLGGYKLTTTNGWGGLQLKNGCSVKNGYLLHTGRVNAIKAWDVVSIEDLVIEVTDTTEGKTIGGISIQENAAGIDSIKNVTMKGEGLDYGIETYNCGNAQVIGTMEKVTIDAVGTGMLLSAPCGTATNCTIKGDVSGIDMLLKGTYSVSLNLVNSTVEGGQQAVYAHDEQKGYTYVGSITLTADEATTFTNTNNGALLKKQAADTSTVVLPEALTQGVATVNGAYYATFKAAVEAANAVEGGATVTLLDNVTLGEKLTISGNVTIEGAHTITRDAAHTGTLFEVAAGAELTLDGGLTIDGGNAWVYTKTPLDMDMANGAGTYVGNHITPAEGGVNATAHLIKNNGTLNANNVTIANSYSTNGVSAIDCGANSVTTLNGATMQNIAANRSGAIVYVGGNDAVLTIKGDTKITGNFGIGNGGIIQNYGQGTTVNMEGGSIDNNHVGVSGTLYASYSGNANKINTFNMSGGSITKNIMEGYGPVYIHTNTVWNMTGGEISENISYLPSYVRNNNPAGTMSGGKIVNNEITGTDYSDGYYVTRPDLRLNGKTGITGGTFTQDVTEYLAPDTGLVYDEATGTYTTTDHVYNLYFRDPATGEQVKDVGPLQGNDPASLVATGKLFYADYYVMELEVLSNAKIDETIVIDYPMTVNLNGHTITTAATAAGEYMDAFQILADVTVKGEGKIDARPSHGYTFYVGDKEGNVGNLTIENGTFYGETSVVNNRLGTVTINGGNFAVSLEKEGDDYRYTLNCIDENYRAGTASIVVKGGTFYKFNPADNEAEQGDHINFCAEGYLAEADGDYYGVRESKDAIAADVTITFTDTSSGKEVTLKHPSERFNSIQHLIGTNDYADFVLGAEQNELLAAIANGTASNIVMTLHDDIALDAPINFYNKYFQIPVEYAITLDGNGHTITWADGYTGTLLNVESGVSLTLENVTIDGENAFTFYDDTTTVENGQNWYTRFVNVGEEDKAVNADVIVNAGELTLGEGTKIQNVTIASDSGNGKTENTETGYILKYNDDLAIIKSNGGKVNLNGASITGNAGMVLNAINATTEINATIDGNMGVGNKGGIIIANGGTMTVAGEIKNNKAMARSATILGVINGAEVTFSGTMENNKHIGVGSNTAGAMVVLEGASQFVMNGGSISNNVGGRAGAIASRWVGGNYGQHEDTSIVLNAGTITGNTASNDSWNGASIFLRSPATIGEGMKVDGTIAVNAAPAELAITGGTFTNFNLVVTDGLKAEISGGTFDKDPAEWCAEGYAPKANEDGTWTVKEKILATLTFEFAGATETYTYPGVGDGDNDGKIDSLQDLIAEYQRHYYTASFLGCVPTNAKLTLNEDVVLNETLVIDKAVDYLGEVFDYEMTIDLNGHTLTGMVENHVELTVEDTVGGGKIDGGDAAAIDNYGKVTIEGGAFSGAICAVYNNELEEGQAEIVINGGEFTAPGDYCATIENRYGILKVNGGKITATNNAGYAIVDTLGETTITGGEISSANGTAVETYMGKIVIEGGDFTGKVIVENQAGTVDVYGGKLVSNTPEYYYGLTNANGGETTLYGGTFERDYATAEGTSVKIADGYIAEKLTDGTYGVRKFNAVAEVNGTQYETLAKAIEAAQAGDTITLLADVEDNVTVGKSLTIDGANFKYTGQILVDSTKVSMTVKNVNFVGGTAYAIKSNGANYLTVENCTVSGHDFLYANKSTNEIVVKNVTVDGGNYGIHFARGNKATLENVKMTNVAYGIMTQNNSAKTITIKNCEIDATTSISVWVKAAATDTFKFEGANKVNGTVELNNYGKLVLADTEATLTAPEGLTVESGVADTGYEVAYENGTYFLANYVAELNGTKYESLQDAIDAAQTGDTVVLLKDINIAEVEMKTLSGHNTCFLVEGKNITVDMDGKTIYGEYATTTNKWLVGVFATDNDGGLTLTGNGTIDITAKSTVYCLVTAFNTGSTVTIENGTYTLDKAHDSLIYYGGKTDAALTVNGGTFTLGNVGEGENGKPWIFNVLGAGDHHVLINGGTFNANINRQHWSNEAVVNKECYTVNNGDGTWTVKEGAVAYVSTGMTTGPYYVRKNIGYATFEEAIKAALDYIDSPITLLADYEGDYEIQKLPEYENESGERVTMTLTIVKNRFYANDLTAVEGIKKDETNTEITFKVETLVAQNTTTGKLYASVSEALAAAQSGETVQLIADEVTEKVVMLTNGVTLDLNGKTLTANYVMAFAGNHIVDNSEGKTGLLKVAQENITLASNNSQMPIWNGVDGYAFATMKMNQMKIVETTINSISGKFRPSFGTVFNGYFADGAEDNGVEILIRLSWNKSNGQPATQEFKYMTDQIVDVYKNGNAFTFTVSGFEGFENFKVEYVVESCIGVQAAAVFQ